MSGRRCSVRRVQAWTSAWARMKSRALEQSSVNAWRWEDERTELGPVLEFEKAIRIGWEVGTGDLQRERAWEESTARFEGEAGLKERLAMAQLLDEERAKARMVEIVNQEERWEADCTRMGRHRVC
jgi:hypothetical protein